MQTRKQNFTIDYNFFLTVEKKFNNYFHYNFSSEIIFGVVIICLKLTVKQQLKRNRCLSGRNQHLS